MRVRLSLEVSICLKVIVEVDVGVGPSVVVLQVLLRDEELRALLALEELRSLISREFEQVLIRRQSLLLQPQFFLEYIHFSLLFFYRISDSCSLLIRLLVVEIERFSERLKVVLRVDQVFNRHLA